MAREMEVASVSLNVVAYGSALKACEMSRSWEQALAILQEMEDRQVHPNVICFNSTISACEKSACWEWALEVLWQMRLRRLSADAGSSSAEIPEAFEGKALGVYELAEEAYFEALDRVFDC
eukprot:s990_g12.t1